MTAVDLSALAIAFDVSKPAVLKRSKKENWPYEEVVAIGGRRRLYPLASLPADVQAAVARHKAIQAANALKASPAYQEGQRIEITIQTVVSAATKIQIEIMSGAE